MSELDGFTDDLKHKVGPLPAWGWGVLGGVGIVVVMRLRKPKVTAPVADAGAVSDPSAEASGIVPTYDASMNSLLHNSSYGSAGGQSIPVPLDQTQFDVLLHDYLMGHGYTPLESAQFVAAGSAPVPPAPVTANMAVPWQPVVTDQPVTPTAGIPYVQAVKGSDVVGQIGHDYAVSPTATQAQRAAALDAWLRAVA